MSANSKVDIDTRPFILEELPSAKRVDDATILQDAGRVIPLAPFTLMSKIASTQKWVPLTDVTPTLTGANMVCGAIGGSLVDFAAISDGEFAIGVDGTLVNVTGLDFTGLDTVQDTPGSYLCGTNGAIIAAGWDAIADGAMTITVNGEAIVLAAVDFTDATTFDEVVETINNALNGRAICTYDANSNIFKFTSNKTGETSTVAALAAGAGGTDISAAGYFNGTVAGAATAGTGGEDLNEGIAEIINGAALGRFFCAFNGDAFVFTSPEFGTDSIVTVLTAVVAGAGTDISGAAYLNGLTGTGTATAGTGGTGSDLPQGIYMGNSITAAALVAADVVDAPIVIFGAVVDEAKLILENSLDLDDVVGAGDVGTRTIRDILLTISIIPRNTLTTSLPENA